MKACLNFDPIYSLATKPPTITQITNFTSADLANKHLAEGEEFWFKGALDRDVQGWIFKPKGFEKGTEKAWPVALLIHGGEYSSRGWAL